MGRARRLLDERPDDNFRRISYMEALAGFALHALRNAEEGRPEIAARALARVAEGRAALEAIPEGTVPHVREPDYLEGIEKSCAALRAIAGSP